MQLVSDEDLTNMIPTLTQDSVEETPMNMSSRAYRMERVSLNESPTVGSTLCWLCLPCDQEIFLAQEWRLKQMNWNGLALD